MFLLFGISFNLDKSSAAQEAVDLATEKSKLCYENKHIQSVWSPTWSFYGRLKFPGQTGKVRKGQIGLLSKNTDKPGRGNSLKRCCRRPVRFASTDVSSTAVLKLQGLARILRKLSSNMTTFWPCLVERYTPLLSEESFFQAHLSPF